MCSQRAPESTAADNTVVARDRVHTQGYSQTRPGLPVLGPRAPSTHCGQRRERVLLANDQLLVLV